MRKSKLGPDSEWLLRYLVENDIGVSRVSRMPENRPAGIAVYGMTILRGLERRGYVIERTRGNGVWFPTDAGREAVRLLNEK